MMETSLQWTAAMQSLRRPYRVTAAMLLLIALVPFYIVLPDLCPADARVAPELPLARAVPLVPAWAVVYGALYGFLILLPIVVVRQEAHVRRTVHAYLTIWLTAYAVFILYPTVAPRPALVRGSGFAAWGLRVLYDADVPYNCFPSLHVAHSFVSAFTCGRVHRGVGRFAIACATLVAVSTLFTKQHYVVDVIAGVALALFAHVVFLRQRDDVPTADRHAAPALALCTAAAIAFGVLAYWLAYRWNR